MILKRWIIPIIIAALVIGAGIGWLLTRGENGAEPADTSPPAVETDGVARDENERFVIDVFFSKSPQSDNDPSKVFPLKRTSDSAGVARFALEQIIRGPTAAEAARGYYTNLKLSGASNCSGDDFTINISEGVANVKFCRNLNLAGDLSGGRAEAQIDASLTQFATIEKVIVLNKAGDCAFDLSGMNLCLED
jgi:hypothetical protein